MKVVTDNNREIDTAEMNDTVVGGGTEKPKDYREAYRYWFGIDRPKPLEKKYSVSRIRKILAEVYDNYQLIDISEYKSNRYKYYTTYRVLDKDNNIVISHCYLHDLGKMLEEAGDY